MFEQMVRDAFTNVFADINNQHTKEVNELKRQVAAAEINASKLGNKLNMANAALAVYEASDKLVEDNAEKLEICHQQLKMYVAREAELENINEDHRRANGNLRADLEATKAEASREHMLHLNIVGEKMEEIKRLATIRDAQKDRILELIERYEAVMRANNDLRQQLIELGNRNCTILCENSRLADEHKKVHEYNNQIVSENQDLKQSNRNARADADALRQENETLRKLNEKAVQDGIWAQRWNEECERNTKLVEDSNRLRDEIHRLHCVYNPGGFMPPKQQPIGGRQP